MDEIVERTSPHFSPRENGVVNAIVIHDTGGKTAKGTLDWFSSLTSKVSSHYLIGKDGTVYRCVDEVNKAWHAGTSELWQDSNVNEYSIGIELVDDNDNDPYIEEQMSSLIELCTDLCHRYRIPLHRVVGHEHIAIPKGRKTDPGFDFPWFEFLNTLGARVCEIGMKE